MLEEQLLAAFVESNMMPMMVMKLPEEEIEGLQE
jgi:hypothetical protein